MDCTQPTEFGATHQQVNEIPVSKTVDEDVAGLAGAGDCFRAVRADMAYFLLEGNPVRG